MIRMVQDGDSMENKLPNISEEFKNLTNLELTSEEKEFKKAFAKHFLGIASNVDDRFLQADYERITRIKENYPVMEFMNLFGRYETIEKIDIDKLFGL